MTTTQTVTIHGEPYSKQMISGRFGPRPEYFVHRVTASGAVVESHLNPNVHRHAIRRIEAAIAKQNA